MMRRPHCQSSSAARPTEIATSSRLKSTVPAQNSERSRRSRASVSIAFSIMVSRRVETSMNPRTAFKRLPRVSCSLASLSLRKNHRASPKEMHAQRTGKRPSAVARATILPLLSKASIVQT